MRGVLVFDEMSVEVQIFAYRFFFFAPKVRILEVLFPPVLVHGRPVWCLNLFIFLMSFKFRLNLICLKIERENF